VKAYWLEEHLGAERAVHGQRWHALHDGYFSDPAIARPLVEAARRLLSQSPADVIVDFGGGTGFLLSQFRSHGVGTHASLVNVDCSEDQLALSHEARISSLCAQIGSLTRGDVAPGGGRVLFVMRSALHYFGEAGLSPLLHYLRDLAEPGEFLLHQTASFDTEEDAACLNALYRYMRTDKWYPTVDNLQKRLVAAGWRVTNTIPAPSLHLTSEDLGRRYTLDEGDIARIRETMAKEFPETSNVFPLLPSGFHAKLHYRIYSCEAAPPGLEEATSSAYRPSRP